jgi:hypothetical protein
MPFPGGCNIGKRPIDAHLNGLEVIWFCNPNFFLSHWRILTHWNQVHIHISLRV